MATLLMVAASLACTLGAQGATPLVASGRRGLAGGAQHTTDSLGGRQPSRRLHQDEPSAFVAPLTDDEYWEEWGEENMESERLISYGEFMTAAFDWPEEVDMGGWYGGGWDEDMGGWYGGDYEFAPVPAGWDDYGGWNEDMGGWYGGGWDEDMGGWYGGGYGFAPGPAGWDDYGDGGPSAWLDYGAYDYNDYSAKGSDGDDWGSYGGYGGLDYHFYVKMPFDDWRKVVDEQGNIKPDEFRKVAMGY